MSFLENEERPDCEELPQPVDWTPVLTLKPHHAIFTERVRKTLSGKKYGRKSSFLLFAIGQRLNFYGYSRDVVGSKIRGIRENFKQEEDFLKRLSELPDDAVVQLDLVPDEICNACIVGKHCMATNYKVGFFPSPDYAESEQKDVLKIHSVLVENGFQEGKDFVFKPTEHVLYDYGGGNFKNVTNPQPVATNFNSLLLKMGALRVTAQNIAA